MKKKSGGKSYIVVSTPQSAAAPHQSQDKKFYKRSNNKSVPMEAYEIEDVRNRKRVRIPSLHVGLSIDRGVFAELKIENRSGMVCNNIELNISANFSIKPFGKNDPEKIKLTRVGAGQELAFFLGSVFEILREEKNAKFIVDGYYDDGISQSKIHLYDEINIGELDGTAISPNQTAEGFKLLTAKVADIAKELRKISDQLEILTDTVGGAGIRLSLT